MTRSRPSLNGGEQLRQQLRRMLQVGVHHAKNPGIGVLPAMKNGAGQAPLALAHQQAHARVFLGDGRNHSPVPSELSSSTTRIS
jgi:hypothetical protein